MSSRTRTIPRFRTCVLPRVSSIPNTGQVVPRSSASPLAKAAAMLYSTPEKLFFISPSTSSRTDEYHSTCIMPLPNRNSWRYPCFFEQLSKFEVVIGTHGDGLVGARRAVRLCGNQIERADPHKALALGILGFPGPGVKREKNPERGSEHPEQNTRHAHLGQDGEVLQLAVPQIGHGPGQGGAIHDDVGVGE